MTSTTRTGRSRSSVKRSSVSSKNKTVAAKKKKVVVTKPDRAVLAVFRLINTVTKTSGDYRLRDLPKAVFYRSGPDEVTLRLECGDTAKLKLSKLKEMVEALDSDSIQDDTALGEI